MRDDRPGNLYSEPAPDCPLCPRLVDFRAVNREKYPTWHNAPVPAFGELSSRLLIVGLAPGLKGANRTGRPFTGDYAGDLLYATLKDFGFARGCYQARPDDRLELVDARITNAVRCLPPENKPVGAEARACRKFLAGEVAAMADLRVILALGTIAHANILAALNLRKSNHPFSHGALHELPGGLLLADSYHCSRYNTNTRRLTTQMFRAVFEAMRNRLQR
ncbi:MAG: uracil-DNA glycosylase [Alphaproteobacteria bacterium]